jgi:hypothetical protein
MALALAKPERRTTPIILCCSHVVGTNLCPGTIVFLAFLAFARFFPKLSAPRFNPFAFALIAFAFAASLACAAAFFFCSAFAFACLSFNPATVFNRFTNALPATASSGFFPGPISVVVVVVQAK